MKLHLRATGCHLPYGITQSYLPPYTSKHNRLNPSQTGRYTRFTNRGRMEGWVALSSGNITAAAFLGRSENVKFLAMHRLTAG